jgi:hypothetical protein
MDGPDYPQDDRPGTPSNVPALIHDYRAQRDAWREQARNLARMREEVLTAADREAHDIVSSARADVRRILLKARRDLLVLAAQVRAAGRLGDADDTPDTGGLLPTDDLGQASNVLTSARHDVRRVLDESRPELEGLASEGEALRAALRQHKPIAAPAPIEIRRQILPVREFSAERVDETPVDFEFTSIAVGDSPEDFAVRAQRPVRAIIAAAATIGGLAVMGTGLWLYRPQEGAASTPTSGSSSSAETARSLPGARPATSASATPNAGARSGPLSLNVAVKRNSWMRMTVDGRVTEDRLFRAGETQQISARREVSIRAGDAGAVMVAVDGRQAVALGREGEVLTRRFAAETPRVQPTPPPAQAVKPTPRATVAQAIPPRPAVISPPPPSAVALPNPTPRPAETQPFAPPPAAAVIAPPANQPAATTAASRPSAAAGDRPTIVPTPPTAATQRSLQDSLTSVATRWLDAYYRQDRATMASISAQVTIADDRSDRERLPRGLTGVQRSLEDVNFSVVTTEAMLTARMTERMENSAAGQMAQAVTFIHFMWSQRNGSWQLHSVRLVSMSRLSKSVR